jgi:hypothetical protein
MSSSATATRPAAGGPPVSRRLNKLVDPISTATEDTPGILPPHHHREHAQHRLALHRNHPEPF